MKELSNGGYLDLIRGYIDSGKPFMGICVGMQVLCQGSAEDPSIPGLGYFPQTLSRFNDDDKSVPQIGWNMADPVSMAPNSFYDLNPASRYYYVHSYAALHQTGFTDRQRAVRERRYWRVAIARYGSEEFIGAMCSDNIFATQFHPEKSGDAGLHVLRAFLDGRRLTKLNGSYTPPKDGLSARLVACLDVRSDESGNLVVTKGDQYDVRDQEGRQVRNLGHPVDMAHLYYEQGADEIAFLNITSFRNCPVEDLPMLDMVRQTARTVFVPLTIGGGIRDVKNPDGKVVSALEVATMYFKSGADKISIGSDAVSAAENFIANGNQGDGTTAIETISLAYGNQAVVISVDPKRVYVESPERTAHHTIYTERPGPNGEKYCWYQCTIKGGREGRDLDVRQLVQAVEKLGAGEILLNCIDNDGRNEGFDLELIKDVKTAVRIPVIASSGAGKPEHFLDAFEKAHADAALGAGMVRAFVVSLVRIANRSIVSSKRIHVPTSERLSPRSRTRCPQS
jgi:glutamine amidotransferase/cyclase